MKLKRILAFVILIIISLTLSACDKTEDETSTNIYHSTIGLRLDISSYSVFLDVLNLRTVEPDNFKTAMNEINYGKETSDYISNDTIFSLDDLNRMTELMHNADFPVLKDPLVADNFYFSYTKYSETYYTYSVWYFIGETRYHFLGETESIPERVKRNDIPAFLALFCDELIPLYKFDYENSPYYDQYEALLYDGQRFIRVEIFRDTADAPMNLSLFTIWQDELKSSK